MIFKVARCTACDYRKDVREPNKKEPGVCSKCGAPLRYRDNWYFTYWHRGKKYRRSAGSQKKFAEDALAKIRVSIREKRFFDMAPQTTWKSATEKFLAWAKTNKAQGTYAMYRSYLNNLAPDFGYCTLDEITTDMVEEYKNRRIGEKIKKGKGKETPITPATVNRELATLKRLCSWATEQRPKLLEINAVQSVQLLKENNERTRYLTEGEIKTLLSNCNTPYLKMAVTIALETGLRKDGVLSLKWKEIEDGTIHKKVKGSRTVHIPITQALQDELTQYRAQIAVVSQYVFPAHRNPMRPTRSDADLGFDTAVKNAGIEDFHFHDLRHTFASHFLRRTKDMKVLQEILGHADMSMTNRYAHLLDEHKQEAMREFNDKREKNDDAR